MHQDFQILFNKTDGKVQLRDGVYLARSDASIEEWYRAAGGTPGSAPFVFPIDTATLEGVGGLPSSVRDFLNTRSQAA